MTDELRTPLDADRVKEALGASVLDEVREIMQAIQREEQIVLNQLVGEQGWTSQSTQVLNFISKMERAASGCRRKSAATF
jgi:hypothetical protein